MKRVFKDKALLNEIEDVVIAGSGKTLIANGGNALIVWNIETGKRAGVNDDGFFETLSLTPDQRGLITSTIMGKVEILDLARGGKADAQYKSQKPVEAIAVTPNGRYVVLADYEEDLYKNPRKITLHVHDRKTMRPVRVMQDGLRPANRRANINSVAITTDGRLVVSGGV